MLLPSKMIRNLALTSLCTIFSLTGDGQVMIDKPIQLNGANQTDRQVRGLELSLLPNAALTAGEEQRGALRYVPTVQGNNWQIVLNTLNTGILPGTQLMIVPPAVTSNGPISISVNSEGPFDLEWKQGMAVLGEEIQDGTVFSVVYDGNAFQVLNGRVMKYMDCIESMVPVGTQFCIDTVQQVATDFFTAAVACGTENKRLCTWGEAIAACTQADQLGIVYASGDYEWIDDTANELLNARVYRYLQCDGASTRNASTSPAPFRCCYTR